MHRQVFTRLLVTPQAKHHDVHLRHHFRGQDAPRASARRLALRRFNRNNPTTEIKAIAGFSRSSVVNCNVSTPQPVFNAL